MQTDIIVLTNGQKLALDGLYNIYSMKNVFISALNYCYMSRMFPSNFWNSGKIAFYAVK